MRCERCSLLVSWLDPFVGVCGTCVQELFKGGVEASHQKIHPRTIFQKDTEMEEEEERSWFNRRICPKCSHEYLFALGDCPFCSARYWDYERY